MAHKRKVECKIRSEAISARDPYDPDFKRLSYVRYANDFLIGVIGSIQDCKLLKIEISNFLFDKLKLNEEKTKITSATKGHANFLGYKIKLTYPKKSQFLGPQKNKYGNIDLFRKQHNLSIIAPIDQVLERLKD